MTTGTPATGGAVPADKALVLVGPPTIHVPTPHLPPEDDDRRNRFRWNIPAETLAMAERHEQQRKDRPKVKRAYEKAQLAKAEANLKKAGGLAGPIAPPIPGRPPIPPRGVP